MDQAFPKKALGQHWLDDPASLQAMAMAADVQQGDAVLEIGPGLGTLTTELISRGAEVLALEFDEDLIPDLQQKFGHYPNNRFVLQQGDIRTFDFSSMPPGYKIVANIPYYLTANLLRLLTEPATHLPVAAALLVQKEVAHRVAAGPGDMAFLSFAAQFYYAVGLGQEVPARLFTPPPKVDSQILILKKRPEPLFSDVDIKDFFRLGKAGFAQRRKTLLNSLSAGLQLDRKLVEAACKKAGIDPRLRAQSLTMVGWHNLHKALNT